MCVYVCECVLFMRLRLQFLLLLRVLTDGCVEVRDSEEKGDDLHCFAYTWLE